MVEIIPKYLLTCIIVTLIIELSEALLLGVKNKKDLLNIFLVNILTNLLLNSILILVGIFLGNIYWIISLIILEIIVFISEGLIYKKVLKYKKINPYLLSLILNISSLIIGQFIN